MTESSDRADAAKRSIRWSLKMTNGQGTLAVQQVGMLDGRVQFLGSVDLPPERVVEPSPTGFPRKKRSPGSKRIR